MRSTNQNTVLVSFRVRFTFLSFCGLLLALLFLGPLHGVATAADDADVSVTLTVRKVAELVVVGSNIVRDFFVPSQNPSEPLPIAEGTVLRYKTNMPSWTIEVASQTDYFYDPKGVLTPKPATDLQLFADEASGWITISTTPQAIIAQRNQPSVGDLNVAYRILIPDWNPMGVYHLKLVFTLVEC